MLYIYRQHKKISRKIMDSYFYHVQRILNNRQESESSAARYEQHFKYTTSKN